MAWNFKKIGSSTPVPNSAPAPAPAVKSAPTTPSEPKKDAASVLWEQRKVMDKPKDVYDSLSSSSKLTNLLQHSALDIDENSLKQLGDDKMISYLTTDKLGQESLKDWINGFDSEDELRKVIKEHKITPREKDVLAEFMKEFKSNEKEINPEENNNDNDPLDVSPEERDSKEKKELFELEKSRQRNITNFNNFINNIKSSSDIGNTDVLKVNGIDLNNFEVGHGSYKNQILYKDPSLFVYPANADKLQENMGRIQSKVGALRKSLRDLGYDTEFNIEPTGIISFSIDTLGD